MPKKSRVIAAVLLFCWFTAFASAAPYNQQGAKLVGTDGVASMYQGTSSLMARST